MAKTLRRRKEEHLRWAVTPEASMRRPNGLERWELVHRALPEMNLEDVDTRVTFLGKSLQVPLIIASMTGGTAEATHINRNLARAAEAVGAAMAVGSQRIMLDDAAAAASFTVVRNTAPHIVLYGNLGAAQLNDGVGPADVQRACEVLGANGMFLHLNALQEAIQAEGNTDFSHLVDRIGVVVRAVPFPILVKEVGCGIDRDSARALAAAGVAAIDVSGAGGTSWARIEGLRATDPRRARMGAVFGEWGTPTAVALQDCRRALPAYPLIASGGIRNGLEAAKALALGANMVALAGPLLKAAQKSADEAIAALDTLTAELRVAMFVSGARDVASLTTRQLRRVRR